MAGIEVVLLSSIFAIPKKQGDFCLNHLAFNVGIVIPVVN